MDCLDEHSFSFSRSIDRSIVSFLKSRDRGLDRTRAGGQAHGHHQAGVHSGEGHCLAHHPDLNIPIQTRSQSTASETQERNLSTLLIILRFITLKTRWATPEHGTRSAIWTSLRLVKSGSFTAEALPRFRPAAPRTSASGTGNTCGRSPTASTPRTRTAVGHPNPKP